MALFDLVTIDHRQHTVVPAGPDAWHVSSATTDEFHTVRRYGHHADLFACSCRDRFPGRRPSRNRATPCRHTRAVAHLLGHPVSGAA